MVWLANGEQSQMIRLLVLTESSNVTEKTDTRTDGHRMTAYAALMHSERQYTSRDREGWYGFQRACLRVRQQTKYM